MNLSLLAIQAIISLLCYSFEQRSIEKVLKKWSCSKLHYSPYFHSCQEIAIKIIDDLGVVVGVLLANDLFVKYLY